MRRRHEGMDPVEAIQQTRAKFQRAGAARITLMGHAYGKAWHSVLTGARTGRVYSWRGRRVIASAPGEPPAKRSGALSEDFHVKITQDRRANGWNYTFSIRSAMRYAGFLERGTARMAARPFLAPIIAFVQPALQAISRLRIAG